MKTNRNHEEQENHDRWLVSYADFITLLFAFFVVMYATSTQNIEKEKKFENSIRAQFSMAGNVGTVAQSGATASRGEVIDPIDLIQRRDVRNEELEDYVVRLLDKNMTAEERKNAISGVRTDNIGVRITLNAANFFHPGSADLKQPAFESLNKVAKILKLANRNVIVEGHTDDTPVVGKLFESNWELASLRATSVIRYLIKVHKINPAKLAAMSYADQRPLVPNTTEENRNQNRRIEILIINTEDDQ